ncbi:MAG: hypothetical protein ACRBB5_08195 [Nitrosopumilus sp.]
MPREGTKQINITMAKKTHDKIRKAWESEGTEKKLSSWVLDNILLHAEKEKWLQNYAPHLVFVGIDRNGILLRDKHLKDSIVEVKLLDNRLWCQACREKNCMHVYYSIGLPDIAKVVDPEENRKR